MPWSVRAVPLPDGDRPGDLWIDATGCLAAGPVPDADPLPGRYVAPGLVDAHAHPALGPGLVPRDDDETMTELAAWAAAGVALVRDTGSPGGSVLGLGLGPGLPRLQAAGRFLAPAGRYFPALLPEEVPEQRLTELALAELARGARWVKVIADFPPVVDGNPSGPAALTYSVEAVEAMIAAVHAAGGRVAAHCHHRRGRATGPGREWTPFEHGTALDEDAAAADGRRPVPPGRRRLCAVLAVPGNASEKTQRRVAEYRERLGELLPLAHRLGVPVLAGTDAAGTIVREVALLAEHGLAPAAALAAATTTGYRFLGEPFDQPGRPATLVTYQDDPREDLAVLSSPSAVLIDGVRVR